MAAANRRQYPGAVMYGGCRRMRWKCKRAAADSVVAAAWRGRNGGLLTLRRFACERRDTGGMIKPPGPRSPAAAPTRGRSRAPPARRNPRTSPRAVRAARCRRARRRPRTPRMKSGTGRCCSCDSAWAEATAGGGGMASRCVLAFAATLWLDERPGPAAVESAGRGLIDATP